MNIVDFTLRHTIQTWGVGVRWLKEELRARNVDVRLTDTSLREFVMDADTAAKLQETTAAPYVARLREEIAARADFLRQWTLTDDPIDMRGPLGDRFVKLARKHALPRPWKLFDSVVSEHERRTPTYFYWTSAN
jgi:hypothetical protein